MKLFFTIVLLAGVGSAALPAQAKVSEHLAKECWSKALKAHPATLPDIPAVNNLRNSYYKLCAIRHGKMDPKLEDAG